MAGHHRFLTSQSALISLLFLNVKPWLPYANTWGILAVFLVGTLSLMQLFSSRPRRAMIWRSLLGYLMYFLITAVLMFLLSALAGFWIASRHLQSGG